MSKISIFTPTFNRAETLPRLYVSLLDQTNPNFDWIIIDDGSTDETFEMVSRWIKLNKIVIRYFKQENGGKFRAHNRAVKLANNDLFLCVDSDDYLVNDAIEKILRCYKYCINDCAGIVAYKRVPDRTKSSESIFPDCEYSRLNDLYINGFKGDTTLIYRLDVLKTHRFPEFENEKFVTENFIYDQIDEKFTLRILPETITVCEYRNDGYSNMTLKLKKDNPKGWAAYYNQKVLFEKNKRKLLYFSAQYICYSLLGKNKLIICNANRKFPAVFMYIAGIILKYKRINQYRRIV